MRICPYCKTKIKDDGAEVCPACGALLDPVENNNFEEKPHFKVDEIINKDKEHYLKKFSWGAFFLLPIWGLCNGLWIEALVVIALRTLSRLLYQANPKFGIWDSIITIAILIASIYYGNIGNRIAWKRRKWKNFEKFAESQQTWAIAGWIWLIAVIAFSIYISTINY